MHEVIHSWRKSLEALLRLYENKRDSLFVFFSKLFLCFVVINVSCYWWAMITAFPEYLQGESGWHYFKIQFPVGILGALFDSFSFFATVLIIRSALKTTKSSVYIAHLSLDVVIAVLATFWVLFVFSFSGWVVNWMDDRIFYTRTLSSRNETYERMLVAAISDPAKSWRNIYFGLIMGVSAMIPTCVHLGMFLRACVKSIRLF